MVRFYRSDSLEYWEFEKAEVKVPEEFFLMKAEVKFPVKVTLDLKRDPSLLIATVQKKDIFQIQKKHNRRQVYHILFKKLAHQRNDPCLRDLKLKASVKNHLSNCKIIV